MLSLSDIIYKGLKLGIRFWEKTRRFTKRYEFLNNSSNSEYLVLILAGYQEYVWDAVLGRIKKYLPSNYDVCIVSPKVKSSRLINLCISNKWSYFRSKANKLATALNTAIKLHPNAKFIFKLDEDIFVGKNFFNGMIDTYNLAIKEKKYKVGLICPVMNVNGASYNYFLEFKECKDEYIKLFGDSRITCDDDSVYKDPNAALFLREKMFPIDDTINEFSKRKIGYHQCGIRYSIGAILFTRDTWNNFKGFISPGNGELAWDELCLCSYCINTSSSILICNNVLAGHFGFGCQKKEVKKMFDVNKERFFDETL